MDYGIAGTSIVNGRGFRPVLGKILSGQATIPKVTGFVRKACSPDRLSCWALKLYWGAHKA